MSEQTPRFALPLLASGQAQKEVTHNEALTLADLLLAPVVESVGLVAAPVSPTPGKGWTVGIGATGSWAGQDGRLAFWTAGGWRFVTPVLGMVLWSVADNQPVRLASSGWQIGQLNASSLTISGNQIVGPRLGAIPSPTGGAAVDVEARAAIESILSRLRAHGLIAV
jgi:Protein of unknown function (DUF2793)